MRRTCQWKVSILNVDTDRVREYDCGEPAVAHITWPDPDGGTTYWYCAKHYDIRLALLRECGRTDVLEASGVR